MTKKYLYGQLAVCGASDHELYSTSFYSDCDCLLLIYLASLWVTFPNAFHLIVKVF